MIVVPENLLTFEFGQSRLSVQANLFLEEAMPFYASAVCGHLRDTIDSLAIQGHTDDRGGDAYNLQLSQERSLAVMVKGLEAIQAQAPSAYQCFLVDSRIPWRKRTNRYRDSDPFGVEAAHRNLDAVGSVALIANRKGKSDGAARLDQQMIPFKAKRKHPCVQNYSLRTVRKAYPFNQKGSQ
jgi:hypothetical protein